MDLANIRARVAQKARDARECHYRYAEKSQTLTGERKGYYRGLATGAAGEYEALTALLDLLYTVSDESTIFPYGSK